MAIWQASRITKCSSCHVAANGIFKAAVVGRHSMLLLVLGRDVTQGLISKFITILYAVFLRPHTSTPAFVKPLKWIL